MKKITLGLPDIGEFLYKGHREDLIIALARQDFYRTYTDQIEVNFEFEPGKVASSYAYGYHTILGDDSCYEVSYKDGQFRFQEILRNQYQFGDFE